MLEWRHPETHEIHWRLERRKSALREKASDRLPAGNIRNVRAHARTEWGAVRNPQCRSALLMLMCPNVGVSSIATTSSQPTYGRSLHRIFGTARDWVTPAPEGRGCTGGNSPVAPRAGCKFGAPTWRPPRRVPVLVIFASKPEPLVNPGRTVLPRRGRSRVPVMPTGRRSSLREAQPSARAGVSRAQQPRQTIDWVGGEGTTAVWRPPPTTAQGTLRATERSSHVRRSTGSAAKELLLSGGRHAPRPRCRRRGPRSGRPRG